MIIFKLTEARLFLRTLTVLRLWNGTKVLASFYLSRIFKRVFHWGMPLSASIEPTSLCNLGCTECPTGLKALKRHSGSMNMQLFTKTVDEIHKYTAYLTLYFQGEPFLNPFFFDFAAYAHKRRIYTTTSTNGHYFTKESCEKAVTSGLSRMIVSMDGTTQEVYENYRKGGQLEKVTQGLRLMMQTKKEMKASTPLVVLQFIVFKNNEHQIEDIKKLAKDIGVDHLALKTAQVYDYEHSNIIPENQKFSRYTKKKDGSYSINNKFYNHCWRSWQSSVLTWDGTMVPCCFDKNASYQLGDLQSQSYREVWEGKEFKQFRSNLLKNRKNIDICRNCIEGTKIWI